MDLQRKLTGPLAIIDAIDGVHRPGWSQATPAPDEASVSSTIEQMHQEIGQVAAGFIEGMVGKVLIYSEVGQGAIDSDMFYVNQADDVVRLRFSPKPLRMLIYSFWERWKEQPGNQEWRTMSYVIDGGKFSIDLTYPNQQPK